MIDLVQARTFEKTWEDEVPHLYQDSERLVTVALGNKVDVSSVKRIPFVHADTGAAATSEEIVADFRAVQLASAGHRARWYRQFTKLIVPIPAMIALFEQRVNEFEGQLRRTFPGYDSFPDPAQRGLLDMIFNLGIGTLTSGFPTLCHALVAVPRRWDVVANTCHRRRPSNQAPPAPGEPDLHEARQAAVKALFLSAVPEGNA